jgi:hypothetical protein
MNAIGFIEITRLSPNDRLMIQHIFKIQKKPVFGGWKWGKGPLFPAMRRKKKALRKSEGLV